jgi:hypothetical protein
MNYQKMCVNFLCDQSSVHFYQFQTAALKISKDGKRYSKAPPPSYFA